MNEIGSQQPMKSTQVSNAMDNLEKVVEHVREQSKHLSERIKSVLRPESPRPPTGGENSGPPVEQVPLAARLTNMVKTLDIITQNIDDTEKRVEL